MAREIPPSFSSGWILDRKLQDISYEFPVNLATDLISSYSPLCSSFRQKHHQQLGCLFKHVWRANYVVTYRARIGEEINSITTTPSTLRPCLLYNTKAHSALLCPAISPFTGFRWISPASPTQYRVSAAIPTSDGFLPIPGQPVSLLTSNTTTPKKGRRQRPM